MYVKNFVDFPSIFIPTNMAPHRWVHQSFKQTLMDACDEYLDTNDRGNEKTRSKLITRVAEEISTIAKDKKEEIPDELEKVIPSHYKCHTYRLMSSISPVCAHLVRKLRGRICQGSKAIEIEGRHPRSSNIIENVDSKVGVCPFILWPHFRRAEKTVRWRREGYRQIPRCIVKYIWKAQCRGSETMWGNCSQVEYSAITGWNSTQVSIKLIIHYYINR